MRSALRLLWAVSVLAASAACVDTSKVQYFGCTSDGACPAGQTCCPDKSCRPSCTGVVGGGGGTQDGGSDDGGAGGGTGGGGGASGSCGPANCTGCCDGDTCIVSPTGAQCGSGGATCQACTSAAETCDDGVCSGCAGSCATGCCTGSSCTNRSVNACGPNGGSCRPCGLTADTCSDSGQCLCGTGPACATGQRCDNGQCVCDATSCVGCCTALGACLTGANLTASACGAGGAACAACDMPPVATCTSPTNRRAFVAPGTCSGGRCTYAQMDQTCSFGCNGGLCENDVCQGCLTPPPTTCVGPVRRSYQSPGTCDVNGCTYSPVDTTCPFGCSAGNCNPDPCQGITCNQPPAPRCMGTTRISYQTPGTCSAGTCTYTEVMTPCPFGCSGATGACVNDPCAGVSCDMPPAATCMGNVRKGWVTPGSCSMGACTYAPQDTTCANGCNGGTCLGDPCQGVTCASPPAPICLNGTTRRTYAATGTCSAGSCSYGTTDTACPFGCANGACNPDPCAGVTCTTPPGATCANGTTRRTYASPGACNGGSCSYTPTDTACNAPPPATCVNTSTLRTFSSSGTCSGGVCSYAPTDTVCNTPPAASCSGSTRIWYASTGSCSGGTCSYTMNSESCAFGCSGGVCNGDPCQGVSCNSPPPATCAGANTLRVYTSPGTCSGGTCSYGFNDSGCPNGCGGSPAACQPCNSTTCPTGCCKNGLCEVENFSACGTNGGSCVSCNVVQTDMCAAGLCRCGRGPPCPLGWLCQDGFCER